MNRDIAIYNYDGNLIYSIPKFISFSTKASTSSVRRLIATSAITRGSGYTDTEIEQSNADLQATFTGVSSDSHVEYKLNWAKGIAGLTIDDGGIFSSRVTSVVISVRAIGYATKQSFAGTAALADISGGSGTKEIDTFTVTRPGVYLPFPGAKERKFEFHVDAKPSGVLMENPEFTPVISNYLESVNVINAGNVGSSAPKLTLDAPAVKAGDANIAAATATFSTETFNPTVIDFGPASSTDINIKIDIDNFKVFDIKDNNNLLPPNPWNEVPRGVNILRPSDAWANFDKLQKSPILIREEY